MNTTIFILVLIVVFCIIEFIRMRMEEHDRTRHKILSRERLSKIKVGSKKLTVCPDCGSALEDRKIEGKLTRACTNFPKCWYTTSALKEKGKRKNGKN